MIIEIPSKAKNKRLKSIINANKFKFKKIQNITNELKITIN